MSKQESFSMDGEVIETLRGGKFVVKLENGVDVTCTLCGKIKMNKIHIITGDKVMVELSQYDLKNGRISWRYA